MLRILREHEAEELLNQSHLRIDNARQSIEQIVTDVRVEGDSAVKKYRQKFDAVLPNEPLYLNTSGTLNPDLLNAVQQAGENIRQFAQRQLAESWSMEASTGRILGQVVRPLSSVGIYIPSGQFPLISTLLMTVIPAQVAGVKTITVACARPSQQILAVARWLGIDKILAIGGAQAIAALAYGTESIAAVTKIVGPGNAYVAAAKKMVSQDVAIDFVAGPSEIVIESSSGSPSWIAADMLAQAEHDVDARAILLTTNQQLAVQVQIEIESQLRTLPTAGIARQAIENNSAIIVCASKKNVFETINRIAPEHLSIESWSDIEHVVNAGSIFIGRYSTEAAGDYVSGPNHVLPTSGVASVRGGLSVNDFVKVITVQEISKDALHKLQKSITTMAREEGLEAHARSVELRCDAAS